MEITEVRVKLVNVPSDRVRAFCSVTFDREFVVRDIKVIEGTNGLFVAMPSRKMADHCPKCKAKNHLRARYCNECGSQLRQNRAPKNNTGRAKLHADIAHPINMACRERIQKAIIDAYEAEFERSKQPGYKPVDLEEEDFDAGSDYAALIAELRANQQPDHDHESPTEPNHVEHHDEQEPLEAEHTSAPTSSRSFGKGIL